LSYGKERREEGDEEKRRERRADMRGIDTGFRVQVLGRGPRGGEGFSSGAR
jgi:hypothetical protein